MEMHFPCGAIPWAKPQEIRRKSEESAGEMVERKGSNPRPSHSQCDVHPPLYTRGVLESPAADIHPSTR